MSRENQGVFNKSHGRAPGSNAPAQRGMEVGHTCRPRTIPWNPPHPCFADTRGRVSLPYASRTRRDRVPSLGKMPACLPVPGAIVSGSGTTGPASSVRNYPDAGEAVSFVRLGAAVIRACAIQSLNHGSTRMHGGGNSEVMTRSLYPCHRSFESLR